MEKELGKKEVEERLTAAKAALAEEMYTAKYGVAMDAEGNPVRVTYAFSRGKLDAEKCKEKYPEIFDELWDPGRRSIKLN